MNEENASPAGPARPHGTIEPAEWVMRFAALVPAGAPVLDLACGKGRHARFFLDRGHPVTAVDIDVSGVSEIAGNGDLTVIEADLEADGGCWPLDERRFGAVIVVNYLWRALLDDIVAAVDKGGVLLYETFAAGNERFGKPSNPDFLLQPGELLEAVRGKLQVVAYRHGIAGSERPKVIQSLCAVNGEAPAPLSRPAARTAGRE